MKTVLYLDTHIFAYLPLCWSLLLKYPWLTLIHILNVPLSCFIGCKKLKIHPIKLSVTKYFMYNRCLSIEKYCVYCKQLPKQQSLQLAVSILPIHHLKSINKIHLHPSAFVIFQTIIPYANVTSSLTESRQTH